MELTSITAEMYEVSKRLEQASKVLYKLAKERAETEREYRIELAKEITRLRAEGVSVTLVPDLSRGNTADLKFQRDLADGRYKSAIESLEALKSQLSALQSILKYQEVV